MQKVSNCFADSELFTIDNSQIYLELCSLIRIFARERRAKLLMLGKMSKLFCPRLTAALSARTYK